MNRVFIIVLFLIFVIIGGWIVFGRRTEGVSSEKTRLRVGSAELVVSLVDDPAEWSLGLSGRDALGENEGMLFVFPDSQRRNFWMKGMRFSLDMLFVSKGTVVEIVERVPAPAAGQDGTEIRVRSSVPAKWVLEVNSGWVAEQGVVVGDRVEIRDERIDVSS